MVYAEPSGDSNLRQRTPSLTHSWPQSCRSLREDWLGCPNCVMAGFSPASFPWRSGPRTVSASCASRTLSPVLSGKDGQIIVAETSGAMWLSRPHCWQGSRESASAFVWALPRRWTMSKSSSCSRSSQRAICPGNSRNHAREPWSVRRTNFRPTRYGRYTRVNSTTARSSHLVTQYRLSGLKRVLLP